MRPECRSCSESQGRTTEWRGAELQNPTARARGYCGAHSPGEGAPRSTVLLQNYDHRPDGQLHTQGPPTRCVQRIRVGGYRTRRFRGFRFRQDLRELRGIRVGCGERSTQPDAHSDPGGFAAVNPHEGAARMLVPEDRPPGSEVQAGREVDAPVHSSVRCSSSAYKFTSTTSSKIDAGTSTPLTFSRSRIFGFSPELRKRPCTFPDSVTPMRSNRKTSRTSTRSSLTPWTSAMLMILRVPSCRRETCTTILIALANCCKITREGISISDISTMASRREKASRGELACTVLIDPSTPVFIACSMSSASAPRHSPTMIRSGRIRSAVRTSWR